MRIKSIGLIALISLVMLMSTACKHEVVTDQQKQAKYDEYFAIDSITIQPSDYESDDGEKVLCINMADGTELRLYSLSGYQDSRNEFEMFYNDCLVGTHLRIRRDESLSDGDVYFDLEPSNGKELTLNEKYEWSVIAEDPIIRDVTVLHVAPDLYERLVEVFCETADVEVLYQR